MPPRSRTSTDPRCYLTKRLNCISRNYLCSEQNGLACLSRPRRPAQRAGPQAYPAFFESEAELAEISASFDFGHAWWMKSRSATSAWCAHSLKPPPSARGPQPRGHPSRGAALLWLRSCHSEGGSGGAPGVVDRAGAGRRGVEERPAACSGSRSTSSRWSQKSSRGPAMGKRSPESQHRQPARVATWSQARGARACPATSARPANLKRRGQRHPPAPTNTPDNPIVRLVSG